jgi:sulfatase maturation enzyme AslB (radical SAM superfamily)
MRNYHGYDFNSGYPLTELSLEDIKKILPPTFLKQIRWVLINGNLGDFGLAQDALDIVKYLLQHNLNVEISTNGSMRSPDWWAQLAHPRVTIGWALDGLEDTHSVYRQDTDWHKVIANASAYIATGGRAVWRFIEFDHNQHQKTQCRELSKTLGFMDFKTINDGRNQGPVYSRNGQLVHWLGTKDTNDRPLDVRLQSHRQWADPDVPLVSNKDKPDLTINCSAKVGEIYIAADGSVYPCCYMGFYPTQMIHPGNTQLQALVKQNNALEHSLEHCIDWFNNIERTWKLPSIAQGRLYHCVENCGQ